MKLLEPTLERDTSRLRLRQWRDGDREPFAALNSDPRVMEHFPSPLSREESDALVERSRTAIAAREALRVAFEALELPEVVSYTAAANERSVAVMRRLGMREDAPFDHPRIAEGHRLRRHRLFRLRRGDGLSSLQDN